MDDPNKLHFPTTMEWIIKNQLEDGSWGDSCYFLLYDRLVCTLSCVLTLAQWRQGDELIAKGLYFLQAHIQDLDKEESMLRRTVGFEMIFPSMLNEAKSLGLNLPYDLPCIKRIIMLREEKKQRIPMEVMNSVPTSLLFSLEGIQELVQWDKILKLQSANGSIWDSPSATAATYLKTHDSKCLEYLTYIVKRFKDHAPSSYPIDTFECSWMIDTIQRLGIDHHFRKEISYILDFLYRNLRKDGLAVGSDAILTDIDDTCMGLRLLRLYGYPISPDVLEYFKDDDGSFVCMMGETHKGISDFFNLYRFSQIAFPGEKTLKQAKIFTEQHLMNSIKKNQVYDKWAIKKALHREIECALENPWKMSLPRLEVQEYISNYGENDVWIGNTLYRLYNINNPKNLELAKLEHNKLHAMHTSEANSILLWWNSSGFDDHLVSQLNPKEIHLSICVAIYEPEFSTSRIAYTKWNCVESILRDMFQSHESIEELKLFCQAINEWKPVLVQVLPTKLKRVFMGAYNTMNELANEAMNAQGKDFFPYLHDLTKRQVQQHLNIREIKDTKKFENFEEYVDRVKRSLAVAIRLVPAMFLMGDVLSDNALKQLDHRSKIHHHLVSYIALLNLVTDHERAAVYLYMKEQKCSEQDALAHFEEKIDEAFAELTHEYLKPNQHIPHSCRRLVFEHGRIIRFYLNKISNDHIVDGMEKVYTTV
nr:bifunctional levopimaradiene synthase [Oncidium hybrid cultivar]